MSTTSASAYDLTPEHEAEQTATFSLLVDNEAGVLHRVVGLFSGRGYNIESLTVAETDRKSHTSRITVVTRGAPHVLEQIEQQLLRLVPVARVDKRERGELRGDMGGPSLKRRGWPLALALALLAFAEQLAFVPSPLQTSLSLQLKSSQSILPSSRSASSLAPSLCRPRRPISMASIWEGVAVRMAA